MADSGEQAGNSSRRRWRAWWPLFVFVATSLVSYLLWRRAQGQSMEAARSLFDALLLGYVVAVGALLALAVHLRQVARDRAVQAEQALAALRDARSQGEQARGALDAAERELGEIFNSISDALYTVDREWRFTMLNPNACQLMRQPREQLLGRVLWEAFPVIVGTHVEAEFRRAADESRTAQFEFHFPPTDRWFSVRAYPHPHGLAVYFQDIGDRKRTEQALLKIRATSERAQRLARLGSWEYNIKTGALDWSDEVLRTFGMTREQLARGLPALLERVHREDRAALVEAQRRLHSGEADVDIEYRVQRDDGQLRVVREVGTLVRDGEGQPAFATGALQDITERRRDEDALREAARRLEQSLVMNRLVMEHSLDVICVLDANGRFAQVSGASERVWGYLPAELLGRDYLDLVHPDDRGDSRAMSDGVMAGHATTDFRNRYVRKDGRVVVMQWSTVWSSKDRLYFSVARDVTGAEQQSRALREAKDSLQRAQEVARMGAWELDLSGNRLTWSDEVYDIFGVARDDFPGTFEAFASRVHPDDLAAMLAAQARALAGEGDLDIEHRIQRLDGQVGYVHERAKLVRDEHGQPRMLAGSVQDVTERKRQEFKLLESGNRMRATVDSALDCIVAMDSEGLIVEFNPAAERTFGYRREQALGQRLGELLVPPSHRAGHAEGLRRYRQTGEARVLGQRREMPALRADGSEIIVELSITPMSEGGRETFVGFMRDITQARRARELEAGQREILAGIASRKPLPEVLDLVARLCERQYPGALCSVLTMDENGERLLAAAAPSLPAAYVAAVHGQRIGPRAGACGTAAYRRERVICTDIGSDPLWQDYAGVAAEHGLRACWSTPVLSSDGRVLATFANYFRDPRAPGKDEMALVDGLASLAAVAIEHANAFHAIDLSEQRFRSLFDEHPDAVYAMDLEGRFTAYNGRFQGDSGYAPAELMGVLFDQSVAPEDRELARRHFQAAAGGEARTYEVTAVAKDARRVDLRITNLPIVVDGKVTGVFGIAHDITLLRDQQRELAAALEAAEARSLQLRRLSESAVTLNRSIGAQDMYQQLVDKLRETLGAHQALVSLNVYESHAQEIHAVSLSDKYQRWAGYQTPSDGSGIYGLVCETNQPLRLTQAELEAHPRWRGFGAQAAHHPPMRGWLAVPLIASSGRNLGVLQLSDKLQGDFTHDDELVAVQFAQMASIAIERAGLIETLKVRNRFFDLSLEIFVIFNPQTMRWTQVNPVFQDLLGYSAEELCSRAFFDFMHPDDHAATRERARRLASGLPVTRLFENRYLSRGGTVHWLEWMSERGEDGLVYGVGRDISQRRKAELALRQTMADLASRNRELQDFAFVASHDLQEPLRKIRAFSDRLQQRYSAQLSPEANDYLSRSSQAAERMQTLINDLLAYSRVTARGTPFASVDMAALLANVAEDLEARLESSGGRIEAGPLPTIEGDPTQLRQVLQNLVANALKFRDPSRPPVVTVTAEPARLDGAPAWNFCFADNGIGFEPRHAEKVFVPFQRLHGRLDYEGTGIGLAIVRRIVERHRGTVVAEGVAGEGAIFTVCLPERQPPVSDMAAVDRLLS